MEQHIRKQEEALRAKSSLRGFIRIFPLRADPKRFPCGGCEKKKKLGGGGICKKNLGGSIEFCTYSRGSTEF